MDDKRKRRFELCDEMIGLGFDSRFKQIVERENMNDDEVSAFANELHGCIVGAFSVCQLRRDVDRYKAEKRR